MSHMANFVLLQIYFSETPKYWSKHFITPPALAMAYSMRKFTEYSYSLINRGLSISCLSSATRKSRGIARLAEPFLRQIQGIERMKQMNS